MDITTLDELEAVLDGKDNWNGRVLENPYHKHPAISQSDAKEMLKTPRHYRIAYLGRRNNERTEEKSKALRIGDATHVITFEPDQFDERFCVTPNNKPATTKSMPVYINELEIKLKDVDEKIKLYRPGGEKEYTKGGTKAKLCEKLPQWANELVELEAKLKEANDYQYFLESNAGKIQLSHDEFEKIFSLRKEIHEHTRANRLVSGGKPEHAFFAVHPETDLMLKGKIDYWHPEQNILVDLKTTNCAAPHAFNRSIEKYGYDFQAAYYIDLVELATGREVPALFLLAIEKNATNGIRIYKITKDSMTYKLAREQYRDCLFKIADCRHSEKWPCYDQEIIEPVVSEWRVENDEQFDVLEL